MPRRPQEILEEISQLDFTGRGEAFVEAKFITPLLEALGYETHRDYEVIRHGDSGSSFKLRYPPVEGGAKPVRHYNPDFIPTIRKKMFWIVEAKTAVQEGFPFSGPYIVQGLQYCIHPEIQAKYLLLTNGRHSAIYDAHASVFFERDIYDPILEFEIKDIGAIWDRLYETLSVERLRGRIEADLKSMYDRLCLSSLDAAYPRRLIHEIGRSQGAHVRSIEANVRTLYLNQIDDARASWLNTLAEMPSAHVRDMMDTPVGVPPNVGELYFFKLLKEGQSHRFISDCFKMDFDTQTIFWKEQAVIALCHLYRQPGLSEDLRLELFHFLEGLTQNELPLVSQVECALLRLHRKILMTNIYPGLLQQIEAELKTAPEIIRFALRPTAYMSTIGLELDMHRKLFEQIKLQPADVLLRGLSVLLKVEEGIEPAFVKARASLPGSERQAGGGLETYGGGGKHWRLAGIIKEQGIIPPRPASQITPP